MSQAWEAWDEREGGSGARVWGGCVTRRGWYLLQHSPLSQGLQVKWPAGAVGWQVATAKQV